MAWRIHDSVKRGEVDNRTRGLVQGRLWVDGVPEPVVLELKGNACLDLAGCLLTFENPGKTVPLPSDAGFSTCQCGTIGDLTASRKVRVPELPIAEFYERRKKGLPAPEHMANCLYLEWFSEANGRVVVESVDYKLTISAPAWALSPEEEQNRQHQAAEGFSEFMGRLSQAIEATKPTPAEEKEWDEFDYEKFLRECDARTDKYGELLDKYKDHPDQERLVAREMGWDSAEEEPGDSETGQAEQPEQTEQGGFDIDEINRICAEAADELKPDPATEGVDWVRTEDGRFMHPLCLRALNSSVALSRKCRELGLRESNDEDVTNLISEFQITSAKLAGALNSLAYGRDHREPAFLVAYLKRALGHLHAAQSALEKLTPKGLLPPDALSFARDELFAIRQEILRLMDEFRQQR